MSDTVAYVTNPESGKAIKVGGPTYDRLKTRHHLEKAKRFYKSPPHKRQTDRPVSRQSMEQIRGMKQYQPNMQRSLRYVRQPALRRKLQTQVKKTGEGRGSRTRGWAADAPKRGRDRHLLKEKCGNKCFLLPDTEGFPICPKCFGDVCTCQIDCRGVLAAKIRARQYKYTQVAQAAEKIGNVKCGR